MPEVFRNRDAIVCVGEDWVSRLKAAAEESPLGRSRLCLHTSDSAAVQEMVIALRSGVLFRPHRHRGKSESFHAIEGELDVLVFDDDGEVARTIRMGPPGSGATYCYRLSTSAWHTVIPRSSVVVFHETTTGPYVPDEPAEYAPWAPEEEAELRGFLERSGAVRVG